MTNAWARVVPPPVVVLLELTLSFTNDAIKL